MLNMRLETGMALAALALHAMFIAYVALFYHRLSMPIEASNIILYPVQLLIVGLFLFALPGFGLAGIAYVLAKREAPRVISIILIAQGILMPLGMLYASTFENTINQEYRSSEILVIPQILFVAGFAPIGLGIHIAKLKPMKRRYT